MRSETDQIAAILGGNVLALARDLLAPGEQLSDHSISDYVNVSADDILRHVNKHGFGASSIIETDSRTAYKMDDWLCIVKLPIGYEVYYNERGERREWRFHITRDAALRDVVKRKMSDALSSLGRLCRSRGQD